MIERKKKNCKECGTPQFIFSNGMCRMCWGKNHIMSNKAPQRPYKPLSPVKRYNIPKKTKKRLNQEKEYSIICGMLDDEAKASGKWMCWFCGNKFRLDYSPDHHHVYGRENDALLNKNDIKLVHRRCHDQYHHSPVGKIKWFSSWLDRICHENYKLYEKEVYKYQK